jgi:type VI secretion system protein ImpM
MSVDAMIPFRDEAIVNSAVHTFGWFGKNPGAGDFVSRRLSRSTIETLDAWFQTGMTALREHARDRWESDYLAAPTWTALLPAGVVAPDARLAVVGPSSDRVGRRFPFCVVASLPPASDEWVRALAQSGNDITRVVDRSMRTPMTGDDFDRGMQGATQALAADDRSRPPDDLGNVLDDLAIGADALATVPLNAQSTFPWPDLARQFDAQGSTSYWWTSARSLTSAGFTHRGGLDAGLFVTLFTARSGNVP